MPEYLAPAVYVEETSFRAKSIEGVSTSTTAFAGPTRKGPITGTPELITSLNASMVGLQIWDLREELPTILPMRFAITLTTVVHGYLLPGCMHHRVKSLA